MSHLRATFAYVKKLAEKGVIKGISYLERVNFINENSSSILILGNTASFDKAVFPLSKYYKYGKLIFNQNKPDYLNKKSLI